jgi:DNA-binding NarL/FixJ family response regulator
MNQARRQDD